ncbi:MAG: hypothetical protein DMD26_18510 [Gemmatimonadetes bacterium]|nr:MAG: hypothetical protein DMD26_18510 [Gemmatimonadota bacterium]
MSIASGDAVSLTRELVRVDSRNPTLVAGAPGEARVARVLAEALSAWGFQVEVRDAAPGRPNVIARVGRREPGARSLILNGHIDVVGVEGMSHPPWDASVREGRLYGRGSSDHTKASPGLMSPCEVAQHTEVDGMSASMPFAMLDCFSHRSMPSTRNCCRRASTHCLDVHRFTPRRSPAVSASPPTPTAVTSPSSGAQYRARPPQR